MRGNYYILIYEGCECVGTVFGEHGKTMYFIALNDAKEYIEQVLDGDFNRYKIGTK